MREAAARLPEEAEEPKALDDAQVLDEVGESGDDPDLDATAKEAEA